MELNLLDRMLADYLDRKTPVTIQLQNKGRVSGTVRAFDSYVVLLDGPKGEIVYRHAISCLMPAAQEPQSRPAQRAQVQSGAPRPAAYPQRPAQAAKKPKQQHPAPKAAAAADTGINSGMKEGLLRWMQEQKAAK